MLSTLIRRAPVACRCSDDDGRCCCRGAESRESVSGGVCIGGPGEIIELASANNIVEKSGAWYSYKGNRIGQGKDNVRTYLQQNKEIAREIEEQVRARLLPPKVVRGGGDQEKSA